MPEKILLEYAIKKLYANMFNDNLIYNIHTFNKNTLNDTISSIDFTNTTYICKVDQYVKSRCKKGLINFNIINKESLLEWINSISDYDNFILEPKRTIMKEFYFSLQNDDNGIKVCFSDAGGIDVELNDTQTFFITEYNDNSFFQIIDKFDDKYKDQLNIILHKLYKFYDHYNFTFMEINPLAITDNSLIVPLDFAVKFDTLSSYKFSDFESKELDRSVINNIELCDEEINIRKIDELTGGSLKFKLLNPNGSIWTLIAGGGASVVYTDCIVKKGLINELANYGEYSGNPPEDLVYEYTVNVLSLLCKSNSTKKIYLLIGGGIANFTYVDKTFSGIIKALVKFGQNLRDKNLHILVRRGGPNYEIGLNNIKSCCNNLKLFCEIFGPDDFITCIVEKIDHEHQHIEYNVEPYDFTQRVSIFSANFNFTNQSTMFIYGYQLGAVQNILDYDSLIDRTPSIAAIIDPTKNSETNVDVYYKDQIILIPVYNSLSVAISKHKFVDTVLNYSSFRSAYKTTVGLIDQENIKNIVVIAEGIPENEIIKMKLLSKKKNKNLIGPATVGGIICGKLRLGNTGGTINNIISSKLNCVGDIGLVTKSGGLLNEMFNIISRYTNGVYAGISIGGDKYPSSTFADIVNYFDNDDNIKLIVILGEIGGIQELYVANMERKKPLIGWCIGESANLFDSNIQFGHAGSCANNLIEHATFKNWFMKSKGIIVPNSFEDFSYVIESTYKNISSYNYDRVFIDNEIKCWNDMIKRRKKKDFLCSISNETKSELEYNGKKISELNLNIGNIIGNLWFKKQFSDKLCHYINLILCVTADHGPCVSGAHNTIIATRANKDIVSSLCSGLLTIGPSFGGAINEAANLFYNAYINNVEPFDFVKNNKVISGIGHKLKTKNDPDSRVVILNKFMANNYNFDDLNLIKYARKIEEITLRKKNNLILNVDGYIAVSLIECFIQDCFTSDEIKIVIDNEFLNGFFILGRTIGLIGHHIDQKRLKQGLYRQPIDSVQYLSDV